ncbi:MAG: type IV secretory system conjugative DNA transfer family protein [Chloroflexi bacterium]|nr:type IV secretory system conjugative DNA transfer family protein [Chloroflexota bacterium]
MPYSYKKGRYEHMFFEPENTGDDIYLNDEVSVDIERNLITMATSRSGKGTCQIIPNLLRWKHSALVIDPKGEAAEATAKAREAMGQKVHVLDPFETCKVPKRFRARLNLLDEIDPQSPHSFRQLNAIADGLMMRHSPEAGHWDGGAQEVLAGFMAHVLSGDTSHRNLIAMRQLLTESNPKKFAVIIDAMGENEGCGRLPITGAAKLTKTGTEAGHFLSGAVSNSKWIDDPFMQACLSDSTFRLSDLKRKPMTVFLVLPFDALADYGRFLRLFVRMALHHMMQKMPNGSLKGERCLFILDEFFSLGNISEIAKSIGGLPGANLHLWPFLQDYNQLIDLYGKDVAGTFFANSDYSFFYGVDDSDTANFVSKECGLITEADLGVPIPKKWQEIRPSIEYTVRPTFFGLFTTRSETAEFYRYRIVHGLMGYDPPSSVTQREREKRENIKKEHEVFVANKEAQYQDELNQYAHAKATIGHALVQPAEVMEFTARHPVKKVSEYAICVSQGQARGLYLKPYFLKK